MTIQQYSMEKYAKKLCDAVEAYDYPVVTYDFQNGREVCHENMCQVEEKIQTQLLSEDPEEVRNGLSNVIYWGYASQRSEGKGPCDGYVPMTGRQKDRIPKFQKVDDRDIDRFIQLVKDLGRIPTEWHQKYRASRIQWCLVHKQSGDVPMSL